jgi:hypothetical protein
MWHSSRQPSKHDVAYLYRVDLAKPKRVPTAAQLAALGKALAARRTCPECGADAGYVIPARGMCNDCEVAAYNAPRTCRECGRVANYVLANAHDNGVCRYCLDGRAVSGEAMRIGLADYAIAERVWL